MKNILFCWALIVLGIVCLRYSSTRGSDENTIPVTLPFPEPGLVVAYPFHIANGGRFNVQLIVTMAGDNASVGMLTKSPIKSNLKVTVDSLDEKNNFKNTQYIESFRHSEVGGFSNIYFFTGPTVKLPRKGNYSIEIVNEGYDVVFENFGRTGGIIRLKRDEKLLGTGWLHGLLHALGYVCISISIISMRIIRIIDN